MDGWMDGWTIYFVYCISIVIVINYYMQALKCFGHLRTDGAMPRTWVI